MTTLRSTSTRPVVISSSHCRRLPNPAAASTFCSRCGRDRPDESYAAVRFAGRFFIGVFTSIRLSGMGNHPRTIISLVINCRRHLHWTVKQLRTTVGVKTLIDLTLICLNYDRWMTPRKSLGPEVCLLDLIAQMPAGARRLGNRIFISTRGERRPWRGLARFPDRDRIARHDFVGFAAEPGVDKTRLGSALASGKANKISIKQAEVRFIVHTNSPCRIKVGDYTLKGSRQEDEYPRYKKRSAGDL